MPFILGANSLAGGGYQIDNSLRFNSGSSDYLSRTTWGTPTDAKKFTLSFWVKRGTLGVRNTLVGSYDNSSAASFFFSLEANDTLYIALGGSSDYDLQTTQLFRDVSAWYHIVYAVDSTQATASNRQKLYINGSQVTAFNYINYTTLNSTTLLFNNSYRNNIGSQWQISGFLNGYMSEFYFIDGQQLTPTDFGEFDEDSGIWKPIKYTGTYGTNGFYLEFQDSGALGTDTSGNGNNFTVNNLTSIDQTTDTPTNNFATLNPLYNFYGDNTYSEGNLKIVAGGAWSGALGTMAVSTGKWYWEIKLTATITNHFIGVQTINVDVSTINPQQKAGTLVLYNNDGGLIYRDNVNIGGTYGTLSSGDIAGMALDMGAGSYGQLTIYKNGVAIASNIDLSSTSNGAILPFSATNGSTEEYNFGNPSFTISSGNSDANGIGNFEYLPPTGYLALCTTNLATDG